MATVRKLRSGRVALSAAFLGLAASAAGACGTPEPDARPQVTPNALPRTTSPTPSASPSPSAPPSPSPSAPPSVAPTPDDYVMYCVDEMQLIVDETYCDLDADGYYDTDYYIAYHRGYPLGLAVGTLLPLGGLYVHSQDAAARSALRLTSTFRNGSTVRASTVGTTGGGTTLGG